MSWQIQLSILIQFLPIPNPFHSKFFPCNWSIFRKIRQIACLARHFRCASNGKLFHYFNSPTFYGGWKHYLHRFHRNYEQCTFAAGPHAQFLAFLAFPAHFRRISGTFRQQYNSYWAFIEAFSCRICLSSKKLRGSLRYQQESNIIYVKQEISGIPALWGRWTGRENFWIFLNPFLLDSTHSHEHKTIMLFSIFSFLREKNVSNAYRSNDFQNNRMNGTIFFKGLIELFYS